MENENKVMSKKDDEENDEQERKHFCKVISAFRFYRLVQLQWYDFSRLHDFAAGGRGWLTMQTPDLVYFAKK